MRRLGAVILTGLLWGSAPAIAAYADHDDNGCWDGECYDGGGYRDGGGGQRYDQNYGSEDDRNRSRNRNRGAFSPGPFDRSPVDAFNGNVICLPGSTCYTDDKKKDEQPPPDE